MRGRQNPVRCPGRTQDNLDTSSGLHGADGRGDVFGNDVGGRAAGIGGGEGDDDLAFIHAHTTNHAHFLHRQVWKFRVMDRSDEGPGTGDAIRVGHQLALG